MKKNMKSIITKEVLIQKWVKERKSQREIADEFKVHLRTIERYIKALGLTKFREKEKYPINKESIDLQNPVYWYFIGLVLADGYIDIKNNRVILQLKDEDILVEISKYFSPKEYIIPISKVNVRTDKCYYSLGLVSKELVESCLNILDIRGKSKTNEVIFPSVDDIEKYLMLLRGVIDGDGCIKISKSGNIYFEIYAHSDKMVETFVKEYKKYFNIDMFPYPVKGKKGKILHSSPTNDLLIQIYEKYPNISIQRKRNIVKKLVDDIVYRYEMINHNNW